MHTFLFSEGKWKTHGVFIDESGEEYEARGETQISHGDTSWSLSGRLEIPSKYSDDIVNEYAIQAMRPTDKRTTWVAINPKIGRITGIFSVEDEKIISEYDSALDRYHGREVLTKASDSHYIAEGELFRETTKISSWRLELEKQH